ncbi:hypothetical protein A1O1_05998 [Capronia coronata CBS 617.96]|uniref:Uncharacterized protein n=1 Tax=Capronia coronata CBS 617.96 TaxID=1182541 RepID=W9XYK4_9EURO|nr:uncharacterized protein A1O1_05998 [Capronia coronata CBS 617.96]EXJ85632.1 hypothetical protein A1O1_05998 [Capronia coronata CBS 617.96]
MANEHRPPVNLSWSLDTTTSKTITLATGIIRAATSDNVQALALSAAELYGATLAMCPSVCMTVEKLGKARHTSHVIEHLAAVIGWSAGDSADYLASTDAGCRFLGLVPPLLTMGGPFKAAQALHGAMRMTAPESQLLPTIRQLRDLLSKLEPKLMRAGFADNYLLGWHIWLTSDVSGLRSHFAAMPERQLYTNAIRELQLGADEELVRSAYPPGSVISDLIRALAELERIGETTFLIVRTPACIATWIIAFVDWCLGVKPTVQGLAHAEEQTKEIVHVHHRESKVLVEVYPTSADLRAPSILTFRKLGNLGKLLQENRSSLGSLEPWTGMVKASAYFQKRLHDLQTYHGLYNVRDTLAMLSRDLPDRIRADGLRAIEGDFIVACPARVFPESSKILRLLERLLPDSSNGPKYQQRIPSSQDVQTIWTGRNYNEVRKVAVLFEELLLASLFENLHTDDCMEVYFVETLRSGGRESMFRLERDIISHLQGRLGLTNPLVSNLASIETSVRSLTGVSYVYDPGRLIVSSKGQVSYSSFVEDMELDGRPMCARRVYPGLLRFEGQTYDYAECEANTRFLDALDDGKVSNQDFSTCAFSAPKDMFEESDSTWLGTTHEDYMSFYYVPSLKGNYSLNPLLFFEAAHTMFFMNGCNTPQCAPEPRSTDMLYCRTIAAAISLTKPHVIRVLSTWGRRAYSLFVKAALRHASGGRGALDVRQPVFKSKYTVIDRGRSCLACTCAKGLEIMQSSPSSWENGYVIILD